MPNPFQRGISFNPMRMKDEIKDLEVSATRLGLLIRQLKTLPNGVAREELMDKLVQESAYLKKSYEEIGPNLARLSAIDSFYCFIPQELKNRIIWLLEETNDWVVRIKYPDVPINIEVDDIFRAEMCIDPKR